MVTQAFEKKTLETLVGPLAITAPQFVPGTIQHSDQITNERRTAKEPLRTELRNQFFYTADSAVYTVKKDEAFLYLGREPTNPVLNNIAEATGQLLATGNYRPKPADIEAVINAPDTLKVKLSGLRLQKNNSEWSYFEINTANYDNLNPEQRRVVERVYGQGDDFIQNMRMLRGNEGKPIIGKTRVYVLNPDYVIKNVPQDGALARASWLCVFGLGSYFGAGDRNVDGRDGLRGVRDPIGDAYKIILGANPDQALRAMTPEIATGLSGLVTQYLRNQQKQ